MDVVIVVDTEHGRSNIVQKENKEIINGLVSVDKTFHVWVFLYHPQSMKQRNNQWTGQCGQNILRLGIFIPSTIN